MALQPSLARKTGRARDGDYSRSERFTLSYLDSHHCNCSSGVCMDRAPLLAYVAKLTMLLRDPASQRCEPFFLDIEITSHPQDHVHSVHGPFIGLLGVLLWACTTSSLCSPILTACEGLHMLHRDCFAFSQAIAERSLAGHKPTIHLPLFLFAGHLLYGVRPMAKGYS